VVYKLFDLNRPQHWLYAIARPFVVCRLSVVCNVRAPYSSLPSVLWHCWLGHLTRKIRPRNDL